MDVLNYGWPLYHFYCLLMSLRSSLYELLYWLLSCWWLVTCWFVPGELQVISYFVSLFLVQSRLFLKRMGADDNIIFRLLHPSIYYARLIKITIKSFYSFLHISILVDIHISTYCILTKPARFFVILEHFLRSVVRGMSYDLH